MRTTMLVFGIVLTLTACGPQHVTVPDTRPPVVPPPADARQPCLPDDYPHQGVLPDVEDGTRGSVMLSATAAARLIALCNERNQTLLDWADDLIEEQNQRPD